MSPYIWNIKYVLYVRYYTRKYWFEANISPLVFISNFLSFNRLLFKNDVEVIFDSCWSIIIFLYLVQKLAILNIKHYKNNYLLLLPSRTCKVEIYESHLDLHLIKTNFSIRNSIVSCEHPGVILNLLLMGCNQVEEARVVNFIWYLGEKHIEFKPPYKKICRQRGVNCCWRDCWVKIELLSGKFLRIKLMIVVYI